jgi:hypothetical protein
MEQLAKVAGWAGLVFLTALAATVVIKILTGSISLDGLLTGDRKDGTGYFSVGRTQLLVFTAIAAISYIRQVISAPAAAGLPDIPAATLGMIGGSQLFYLAGKARALWHDPSAPSSLKRNG